MDDLGMSYTYDDGVYDKDKLIEYQDERVLREIGGKFLSELLVSPNPVTVRISRRDQGVGNPNGYSQRMVTFRLHVRNVQSMTVREVKMEDLPTRTIALNYKQELIRRFKRFIHRSFHG